MRTLKKCFTRSAFLWRNVETKEIDTYVLKVMSFGATSSPFCAQYIKNKNAEEFVLQFPVAVHAIIKNYYVDDFIANFESEMEAAEVAKDVIYVHSQGGFEIRNFRSNSQYVLDQLKCCSIHEDSYVPLSTEEKVLGL